MQFDAHAIGYHPMTLERSDEHKAFVIELVELDLIKRASAVYIYDMLLESIADPSIQ